MKTQFHLYTCAVVLLVLGLSCKRAEPSTTPAAAPAVESKAAFVLQKQAVSKTLRLPAELLPFEKAEINTRVEGFVQKVLVDIGDRVSTGSILAVLEAPEAAARSAEAVAKVQEVKARLVASADRYQRLLEASKSNGVVAAAEIVSAKNLMQADSAALAAASSLAQVYKQLQSYLVIRAPFAGIITKRVVDPGDLVGKGAEQSLLFVLEQTNPLRLKIPVPESFINNIPEGQSLSFSTDAAYNQLFSAKLSRKAGSIDPATRTEMWEYLFDNRAGLLKPGMYCIAQLALKRPSPSFVVPFSAVVTTLEKRFVVRSRNGVAEWVEVRQGISLETGLEIFADLQEGDTLLVRGTEEIKAGTALSLSVMEQ